MALDIFLEAREADSSDPTTSKGEATARPLGKASVSEEDAPELDVVEELESELLPPVPIMDISPNTITHIKPNVPIIFFFFPIRVPFSWSLFLVNKWYDPIF
jgi:hypothetical protein